ncbi:MAG: acyltransferase, partial [Rhodospirillales bacterium]|nr:acyltransferase [Rhodospirillales bacterium]
MVEATDHPRYEYIDSVRGYAVLLVMLAHYVYLFADLPYPLHRLAVMGWYGVQLFFLASCVTLLMSRDHEIARRGTVSTGAFFLRRIFRIAPAFYVAAAIYFVASPPRGGFDAVQALATLGFVNAWHPLLAPTVPGAWTVVPGSWSISVEF